MKRDDKKATLTELNDLNQRRNNVDDDDDDDDEGCSFTRYQSPSITHTADCQCLISL
jgi:hypothetical protein